LASQTKYFFSFLAASPGTPKHICDGPLSTINGIPPRLIHKGFSPYQNAIKCLLKIIEPQLENITGEEKPGLLYKIKLIYKQ